MTLRFSSALTDFLNEGGSMKQALANGKLHIYSGAQPSDADSAVAGTLLATITDAAGAHTSEVRSAGSATLAGASGSITSMTVNGVEILGSTVAFDTDLATTATAVATAINNNSKNMLFVASALAAKVTVTAKPGLGTLPNGWVLVTTGSTMTSTDVNMGTEVAGVLAVNGLKFGDSAAGILSKLATQVWSGLGLTDGVAGWFRYVGSKSDAGAADSSGVYIRVDGAIATSGSQLNTTNTNIATGATQTVGSFTITLPEQQ